MLAPPPAASAADARAPHRGRACVLPAAGAPRREDRRPGTTPDAESAAARPAFYWSTPAAPALRLAPPAPPSTYGGAYRSRRYVTAGGPDCETPPPMEWNFADIWETVPDALPHHLALGQAARRVTRGKFDDRAARLPAPPKRAG